MASHDIEALALAAGTGTRNGDFLQWAGAERQTLAVVFTDLVGSTSLNNQIKDEEFQTLRRAHFARGREIIVELAGCEIKTIGDAFLAVFRSVDKALDFAIGFSADPGAPNLQVRAGIHTGPIQPEAGDIFGREVAFGARVVAAIRGPEIWLSDRAMSDIEGLGARRFRSLSWESHEGILLKGFPGTYKLWSLASQNLPFRSTLPAAADAASVSARLTASNVARREFDARAQNYDRVDFVSSAEVAVDSANEGRERGIYAQVDFIERLYVEVPRARIEFSVRRAYVTVDNVGPGNLERTDYLRIVTTRRNAKFVTLHDAPQAISICIDPDHGKTALAEMVLPPTPRENYMCQIGTASPEVEAYRLRAELRVSLDVEGLFLADEIAGKVSAARKKQIEAIVQVAAKKSYQKIDKGMVRRPIEVAERKR